MGFRDSSHISSCPTLVSSHWNGASCFIVREQWQFPSQRHCQRVDDGYSEIERIPTLYEGGIRTPPRPLPGLRPLGQVPQSCPRGSLVVQNQLCKSQEVRLRYLLLLPPDAQTAGVDT